MASIQPWVTDAIDIRFENLGEFRESLMHETPAIESFLDGSAGEKYIVAGPKGVGKSLLLVAKRRALSEHPGMLLLPQNMLVDRPVIDITPFRQKDAEEIRGNPHFWSQAWTFILVVSILKQALSPADLAKVQGQVKHKLTKSLIDDDKLTSIFDLFSHIFTASRSEYFACLNDSVVLMPRFRHLHSPVALFFDNIDEFLGEHLRSSNSRTGLDPEFWYQSQVGAAMAVRQLAGVNRHVKIYCSLRKEALERGAAVIDEAQQLAGACLVIGYDQDDLLDIVRKNISVEKDRKLADPSAKEEFAKFVGKDNLQLEHRIVARPEKIEDYLVRHTLGRPRDLMHMCSKIAEIPAKKRNRERLRDCVNSNARDIASFYLSETRHHIIMFDEQILWPLLMSNVLTEEDVKLISTVYNERYNEKHLPILIGDDTHIFKSLYRLGLVGRVVDGPAGSGLIQYFRMPGGPFVADEYNLPPSQHYLVHPVLYSLIADANPSFRDGMNVNNIIGPGQAWRRSPPGKYVLQGDVVQSSSLSPEVRADLGVTLTHLLAELRGPDKGEFIGGDSIWMASDSGTRLIAAAIFISRKLDHSHNVRMRFGIHFGAAEFKEHAGRKVESGDAFRTAQRLQTKANAGSIYMSEVARTHLNSDCPSNVKPLGPIPINRKGEKVERHNVFEIPVL